MAARDSRGRYLPKNGREIQATLVGFDDLDRKLRQLGGEIPGIAAASLLAGGEVIRAAAVENLKANETWLSGTLARSIHVEPEDGLPS